MLPTAALPSWNRFELGLCCSSAASTFVWREEAASIWGTALMQLILGPSSPFRVVTIKQWDFGAPSAKPTSLLTANVPLEAHLAEHSIPWRGAPSLTLRGLDRHGRFQTAKAKEYPSVLSRAFAAAMFSTLKPCKDSVSADWQPAAQHYAALCAEFVGAMMPDYQPVA